MIDGLLMEESSVGRAWFSPDRKHRLRLQRWITTRDALHDGRRERILAFVMLNPSDADAFIPDPTIHECCKRAARRGFDTVDVVNLFSFRTPYPTALRACERGRRGADQRNDQVIADVTAGAELVIAAWGNDGNLDNRDLCVRSMLWSRGIALHCLGTTQSGAPKHPLARGRHRIPDDFVPVRWT